MADGRVDGAEEGVDRPVAGEASRSSSSPSGIRTRTFASGARTFEASTSNDSISNAAGACFISSETIASRSSAVTFFFLSASSLKRLKAVFSAAPST